MPFRGNSSAAPFRSPSNGDAGMTTTVQKIAMVFGVVFLLIAIVGFITPGGMAMTVDPPGMLLGMFPINMLHNVVHLLFGIWGLAASRSWSGAKSYCQIGG